MARTAVEIRGLEPLLKKLNHLGRAVYKPALLEGGAHIKNVIAVYPRARLGSTYIRTGTLGRTWTVKSDGDRAVIVGNNTTYGPWVQAARQQTKVHAATGWKTDEQVARDEAGAVKAILARHIREAIRR